MPINIDFIYKDVKYHPALHKEARRLGVSVFFITGVPESQRAVTERNLQTQGFANWQQLILRSPSLSSQSVDTYKSNARAQGYKLVLNVGVQWSDLKGNPEAEFSAKYRDPYYFLPQIEYLLLSTDARAPSVPLLSVRKAELYKPQSQG